MNSLLATYLGDRDADIPEVNDLRNLEAPEPLETILLAGTHMSAGECFLAHLPHVLNPLFPHLEARGLDVLNLSRVDAPCPSGGLSVWVPVRPALRATLGIEPS